MRAYRHRKHAACYKLVSRWQPADLGHRASYSDHRFLDARSLAMHCKIARKIDENLDLLEKPRENLKRWSKSTSGPLPDYIKRWRAILDKPWPEVAAFITSISEDAVRLRQSSPFPGVLTPQERRRIYDAFTA